MLAQAVGESWQQAREVAHRCPQPYLSVSQLDVGARLTDTMPETLKNCFLVRLDSV